jgi:hypothetical protein
MNFALLFTVLREVGAYKHFKNGYVYAYNLASSYVIDTFYVDDGAKYVTAFAHIP